MVVGWFTDMIGMPLCMSAGNGLCYVIRFFIEVLCFELHNQLWPDVSILMLLSRGSHSLFLVGLLIMVVDSLCLITEVRL